MKIFPKRNWFLQIEIVVCLFLMLTNLNDSVIDKFYLFPYSLKDFHFTDVIYSKVFLLICNPNW